MKIFIVADIEGAVGISKRSQCYFMKPDFQYGRRCLTDDVNAVVKGAIEAGADGIVVRDTHETGENIIRENLPPGVEYIGGQPDRPFPILGDPSGADLVFLVASHARSGSPGGFFPPYFLRWFQRGADKRESRWRGFHLRRHTFRVGHPDSFQLRRHTRRSVNPCQ